MPDEPPITRPQIARTLRIAIALSLTLFVILLLARNHLRAEWCRWKITHTDAPAERAYYLGGLLSLGPPAHAAVIRLAHDPQPEIRSLCIVALAKLPAKVSVPALVNLLDDPDEDIRLLSATTLGLTRDRQATDALARALSSNSPRAAQAAAAGLARPPSADALPTLTRALGTGLAPLVEAQIIESIGDHLTRMKNEPPDPKLSDADLRQIIQKLIQSLDNQNAFSGQLALEYEIAAATAYLQTTITNAADAPVKPETVRSVADIAAAVLAKLTGHPIARNIPRDAATIAEMTDQCVAALRHGRSGQ